VINANLPRILRRFRDIAFDRSKIAIFCVSACQRIAKAPNARRKIAENYNRLSRVHERYRQTDDRQTDGREQIANMIAKNLEFITVGTVERVTMRYCAKFRGNQSNRS